MSRGRRIRVLLAVAAVLAIVALAQHLGPWAVKRVRSRRLEANVVLVLVDTLRADRVGCLGSDRPLTPRIDDFAAGATLFTDASAHSSWTLPSVASLYTSTPPEVHGAGGKLGAFHGLDPDRLTVAEVFERNGAVTAAVINVLFMGAAFGMDQGFAHLDEVLGYDNEGERKADATTDAALTWIDENRGRRFFLLVHYFDPHLTYDPPPAYRRRFAPAAGDVDFGTARDVIALRRGRRELAPGTVGTLAQLYDAEVAWTDSQVGRLIDGIRERGLWDSTVVAFASDHGEELLDHGGFEHGHTLYQELIHVPLAVRRPHQGAGRVVETPVRLVDLAPTLLELAGLPVPRRFGGRSLVALMEGGRRDGLPVLASGNMWGPPLFAWRRGSHKLVIDTAEGVAELFDLEADPAELDELSGARPRLSRTMEAELAAVLDAMDVSQGAEVELDAKQRQMLEALGYVE